MQELSDISKGKTAKASSYRIKDVLKMNLNFQIYDFLIKYIAHEFICFFLTQYTLLVQREGFFHSSKLQTLSQSVLKESVLK